MNVKIVEENCIGCGMCRHISADIFNIEDVAIIAREVTEKDSELINEAIECCPTGAIIIEN